MLPSEQVCDIENQLGSDVILFVAVIQLRVKLLAIGVELITKCQQVARRVDIWFAPELVVASVDALEDLEEAGVDLDVALEGIHSFVVELVRVVASGLPEGILSNAAGMTLADYEAFVAVGDDTVSRDLPAFAQDLANVFTRREFCHGGILHCDSVAAPVYEAQDSH